MSSDFDSWVGVLSVEDYRDFVLPITKTLIRRCSRSCAVIYFGVETGSLLPAMRETGADVLGWIGVRLWARHGNRSITHARCRES